MFVYFWNDIWAKTILLNVIVVLIIVYCYKILGSKVRLSQCHLSGSINSVIHSDYAGTSDADVAFCIHLPFNLASQ